MELHASSDRGTLGKPNMGDATRKLWPFAPKASLIWAIALLIGLVLALAVLRATLAWPSTQSENVVLIGVIVLSLLPIVLALLDLIIERGAVIEYAGIKVDFSQTRKMGVAGIVVPSNIGVRGQSVADSGTTQIVDALRQATASDVVVIDLEDGQAWWETRLLVLLAGAERLGKPEKVVFVGTDAKREQQFMGWAYAGDLLPHLANAHPQYRQSLQAANAALRQWELVETPPAPPLATVPPTTVPGALATQHPWLVFDPTGLRNELLAEQLLQSDLGQKVEQTEGARSISLVRLEDLFRPVLSKDHIDLDWPQDRQLDAFLSTESPSIAITQNGRYSALVSRLTLLNQVLKPLVKARDAA